MLKKVKKIENLIIVRLRLFKGNFENKPVKCSKMVISLHIIH